MKLVTAMRSGLLRPSEYFTQASPAASASAILAQFPWAPSGPYWIAVPTVGACQLYVDFDYAGQRAWDERIGVNNDNGGPWVCVMTAQRDGSAGAGAVWGYGNAAYTTVGNGQTSLVWPWQNKNRKSAAFDYLPATAARIDCGNQHFSHWWEYRYNSVSTLQSLTCQQQMGGSTDQYMLKGSSGWVYNGPQNYEALANASCLNDPSSLQPRRPHMVQTAIPHSVWNNTLADQMRTYYGRNANDNGRVGFVHPDRGSYGRLGIGFSGDSDASDNNDWVCGFGAAYGTGSGGPGAQDASFALMMHENCDDGYSGGFAVFMNGTLWIRN